MVYTQDSYRKAAFELFELFESTSWEIRKSSRDLYGIKDEDSFRAIVANLSSDLLRISLGERESNTADLFSGISSAFMNLFDLSDRAGFSFSQILSTIKENAEKRSKGGK